MSAIVDWFDANFIAIVNGLAFGSLLYTLSVGLSLILGAMNVLNMAHGVMYLVGAYVAVAVIGREPSWTMLLIAAGLCVAFGIFTGGALAVLAAPLLDRKHSHVDQALLTLGLALIGGNLLTVGFGGDTKTVATPPGLQGRVDVLEHVIPSYRIFLIGFGLVVAVAVTYVMDRTPLGAIVRATVADAEMVRAIGIDTRKVVVGILALGCVLAMLGGVLGAPYLGTYPGLDWTVLLVALVVVVIGGMGSVKGAFIGAIIVGQVQILGTQLVPTYAPFLLLGAMTVVLVVRPRGLMGMEVH